MDKFNYLKIKDMTDLEKALVSQGHTPKEAEEIMREMVNNVFDGEDPEEILYSYGLEPDYVFDILNFGI